MDLKSKTIVITGAAQGIGRALSLAFAQAGSNLALIDMNLERLEQTCAEARLAGILRDGLLIKARDGAIVGRMSLEHWRAVIDVNLTGVFLCGRAAAERM